MDAGIEKMSSDVSFQENLSLWSTSHPKEGVMLPYVAEKPLPYAETSASAKEWFEALNLENIEVLYVYGIGYGHVYRAALPWLQKDQKRNLVFLEDDPSALYHFFHRQEARALLEDRHVQLHFFNDLKDNEAILEVTYWDFLTTKVAVSSFPPYLKRNPKRCEELEQKILFDTATKNALVDEYLKYGAGFFKNFYPNMRTLPSSLWGNAFFGKFRKIPAIICGAGPSLVKSLPQLKELQDQALIFAGGSAVNALDKGGVVPHFGAGIDPNQEQYKRFSQDISFEVPFFYRNRMFHKALMAVKGPHLYVSGSGGYDVADWFESKFDIAADFLDEGHNVVNFCTEIARRMGCDPIIFVGLDLAYTGMQLYAPGVIGDSSVTAEELLRSDDMDVRAIIREDIYGKKVYTHWKWVAESEWLSEFSSEYSGQTLLNATEGGIGIPNVANIALKDAVEEYLSRQFPLKEKIKTAQEEAKLPHVTKGEVDRAFRELKKSLEQSIVHLTTLIDETEQLKLKNPPTSDQSGLAALAETELAEEPAYGAILDIFNAVYSRVLSRDLNTIRYMNDPNEQRKAKLDLNIVKFRFLRDVAAANLELME